MKQFYGLILALFVCAKGLAQTDPISTQLNSVFANVNKSQIPTGFLQEYGIPFLPLEVFNGVLTDSNKVDNRSWRMVYASLQTARINGPNLLPDLPMSIPPLPMLRLPIQG